MVRRVHKVFGALLAALFAGVVILPGGPAYATLDAVPDSCGTERWHVKTLDDPDAPYVHLDREPVTVAQMRTFRAPAGFSAREDARRYAGERQEYVVQALLVGFKREADRDYHIVIADPAHPAATMVAEVPDPTCAAARAGGHAGDFAAVRKAFDECFGPPTAAFRRFPAHMVAEVEGVGFFDVDHGQTGRARLGDAKVDIELHPVLSVLTMSGDCPK